MAGRVRAEPSREINAQPPLLSAVIVCLIAHDVNFPIKIAVNIHKFNFNAVRIDHAP